MNAASAGFFFAAAAASGWSGAIAMNLRAEQSVRPRGEDFQFAFAVRRGCRIEREAHQQALGAADPVLLHQPDFFRPALERSSASSSSWRIFRDLEEPLRQLALLDQRAGAPAAAVDHLLVGQHRMIDRIPVHLRLLALDQTGAQEIEEHLLLVPVIGRIAGRDLAAPVERQPHRLQLLLHRRDVLVGPRLGMDLALDCGVLGRHAEGVPAHRMQHVETPSPASTAPPRRPSCSCARGPYGCAPTDRGTSPARSISVVASVLALGGRGEDAALFPDFLPAGLGLGGVVAVGFSSILVIILGSSETESAGGEGSSKCSPFTTSAMRSSTRALSTSSFMPNFSRTGLVASRISRSSLSKTSASLDSSATIFARPFADIKSSFLSRQYSWVRKFLRVIAFGIRALSFSSKSGSLAISLFNEPRVFENCFSRNSSKSFSYFCGSKFLAFLRMKSSRTPFMKTICSRACASAASRTFAIYKARPKCAKTSVTSSFSHRGHKEPQSFPGVI